MIYTDFAEIPLFKYGLIMADPPWLFKNYSEKGEGRSAKQHYDCMPTDEICDMNFGEKAAPDCALLIWGTSPMLHDVLRVIEAWGFTYKGKAFGWAKLNKLAFERQQDNPGRRIDQNGYWFMGTGYGTRSNTEDCWLATSGSPKRLDRGVRQLIVAPLREHSRKPDEAYARALRLFPGPYLDAFGRQERDGWDLFNKDKPDF